MPSRKGQEKSIFLPPRQSASLNDRTIHAYCVRSRRSRSSRRKSSQRCALRVRPSWSSDCQLTPRLRGTRQRVARAPHREHWNATYYEAQLKIVTHADAEVLTRDQVQLRQIVSQKSGISKTVVITRVTLEPGGIQKWARRFALELITESKTDLSGCVLWLEETCRNRSPQCSHRC